MGELSNHINIGRVLEEQLYSVGINTFDALKKTGSREAWLKIRGIDPSACYNRLCALEGAIRGVRWHDLPDETKAELKDFYRSFR